jgi:hypothetical protein
MGKRGPKTVVGLLNVRYNAIKHGIYAETPVLPNIESEEDWETHRQSIIDSIAPENGLIMALTERCAVLLWRLNRVIRYERESIARSQSSKSVGRELEISAALAGQPLSETPEEELIQQMDDILLANLVPGAQTIEKIMRYETRLHRHLLQTLHQIHALRSGSVTPRPRTDIEQTDITRIGVHSPQVRLPAPHH